MYECMEKEGQQSVRWEAHTVHRVDSTQSQFWLYYSSSSSSSSSSSTTTVRVLLFVTSSSEKGIRFWRKGNVPTTKLLLMLIPCFPDLFVRLGFSAPSLMPHNAFLMLMQCLWSECSLLLKFMGICFFSFPPLLLLFLSPFTLLQPFQVPSFSEWIVGEHHIHSDRLF